MSEERSSEVTMLSPSAAVPQPGTAVRDQTALLDGRENDWEDVGLVTGKTGGRRVDRLGDSGFAKASPISNSSSATDSTLVRIKDLNDDDFITVLINNDGTISMDDYNLDKTFNNAIDSSKSLHKPGSESTEQLGSEGKIVRFMRIEEPRGGDTINLVLEGYSGQCLPQEDRAPKQNTDQGRRPSQAELAESNAFVGMDREQLLRLEKMLHSDEAKEILGENMTAMLDTLIVEEEVCPPVTQMDVIRMDHCYSCAVPPPPDEPVPVAAPAPVVAVVVSSPAPVAETPPPDVVPKARVGRPRKKLVRPPPPVLSETEHKLILPSLQTNPDHPKASLVPVITPLHIGISKALKRVAEVAVPSGEDVPEAVEEPSSSKKGKNDLDTTADSRVESVVDGPPSVSPPKPPAGGGEKKPLPKHKIGDGDESNLTNELRPTNNTSKFAMVSKLGRVVPRGKLVKVVTQQKLIKVGKKMPKSAKRMLATLKKKKLVDTSELADALAVASTETELTKRSEDAPKTYGRAKRNAKKNSTKTESPEVKDDNSDAPKETEVQPQSVDQNPPPTTPTPTTFKKHYPKRENRKPPAHLADAFGPALFSTPDIIRRVSLESKMEEANRVTSPEPHPKPPAKPTVAATSKSPNTQDAQSSKPSTTTEPEPDPQTVQQEKTLTPDKDIVSLKASAKFLNQSEILAELDNHLDLQGLVEDCTSMLNSNDAMFPSDIMDVSLCPLETPTDASTLDNKVSESGEENVGSDTGDAQADVPSVTTFIPGTLTIRKRRTISGGKKRESSETETSPKEEKKAAAKAPDKPARRASLVALDDEGDYESDDISWNSEDDPDRLWCICKKPHNNRFMICCDICSFWFHGKCVGITKAMGKEMERKEQDWTCPSCVTGVESKVSVVDKKSPVRKQSKITSFLKKGPDSEARGEQPGTPTTPTAPKGKPPAPIKKTVQTGKEAPASTKLTDASKSGPGGVMLCVVCSKNKARVSSIYCSDTCILTHAQESGQPSTSKVQTTPFKSPPSTSQGASKSSVGGDANKKSKSALPGKELLNKKVPAKGSKGAQANSTVKSWLLKNMANSSEKAADPAVAAKPGTAPRPRHIQLIGMKELPPLVIKPTTKGPPPSPTKAAKSPTKTVQSPKGLVAIAPKVAKTIIKFVDIPTKSKVAPQVSVSGTKEKAPAKRAEPKQPTPVDVPKKEEEKSSGPEPIRLNVRKTLHELLTTRIQECEDLKAIPDEKVKKMSLKIEEELFANFKDTGTKYKSKYRSLVFNIKDPKNLTLFRKIAEKSVTPHQLVRLSPEELASQELADWREREAKHQLEMIKKNEMDLMSLSKTYVMKTHKGEQVIENDAGVLPLVRDLDDGPDVPDVPPAEDPSPVAVGGEKKSRLSGERDKSKRHKTRRDKDKNEKSHKRDKSRHSSKSKHHDRHHDKHHDSDKKKDKSSTEKKTKSKVEKTVNKVVEESWEAKVSDMVADPASTEDVQERLELDDEPPDLQPQTLNENTESDTDLEPTSTVTIKTPDISESVNPSLCLTVWKGVVSMLDVSKFFSTMQIVHGDPEDLFDDLPDSMNIVGRISPNTVWDYISKMKKSGTKDILIIRLTAGNDEEHIPYISLYSYLSGRNRLGVVGRVSKKIKDFYILPLSKHNPVPQVLLPLDGPGFEDNRPHLLLGVVVRSKQKLPKATGVAKLKTNRAYAGSPSEANSPPERSYTPPLPDAAERSTTPPLPVPGVGFKTTPPCSPYDNAVHRVDLQRRDSLVIQTRGSFTSAFSSALDDGDEPYSPGGSDDDLDPVDVMATPTNQLDLQRTMEELNRKIAEQKQQIQSISSAIGAEVSTTQTEKSAGVKFVSSYAEEEYDEINDGDEAYSPSSTFTPPRVPSPAPSDGKPGSSLPQISLPPNLQEILANIKKQSTVKIDLNLDPIVKGFGSSKDKSPVAVEAIDDDEAYVPPVTSKAAGTTYVPGSIRDVPLPPPVAARGPPSPNASPPSGSSKPSSLSSGPVPSPPRQKAPAGSNSPDSSVFQTIPLMLGAISPSALLPKTDSRQRDPRQEAHEDAQTSTRLNKYRNFDLLPNTAAGRGDVETTHYSPAAGGTTAFDEPPPPGVDTPPRSARPTRRTTPPEPPQATPPVVGDAVYRPPGPYMHPPPIGYPPPVSYPPPMPQPIMPPQPMSYPIRPPYYGPGFMGPGPPMHAGPPHQMGFNMPYQDMNYGGGGGMYGGDSQMMNDRPRQSRYENRGNHRGWNYKGGKKGGRLDDRGRDDRKRGHQDRSRSKNKSRRRDSRDSKSSRDRSSGRYKKSRDKSRSRDRSKEAD